ncbi:MAG: fused MFS/spermidine synthase [Xanthomonadales bacterium]|nr:fused MFS/spermidine synthase [Xanthomonadales bacterium]
MSQSSDLRASGLGKIKVFGLLLFFLSGMTGLVYQSVWSHYLGNFLGHAAYAQAAILVIFMGGLGLGGYIGSRVGRYESVPFQLYAILELVIGVAALVFHWLFVYSTKEFIEPGGGALLVNTLRFLLSAALLLPPSILLGMTFPLFTEALTKVGASIDGRTIAISYFTNSIGASMGALVSVFVLIPAVGLPGTLLTAGIINILIGAFLYLAGRTIDPEKVPSEVLNAYEHRQSEPKKIPLDSLSKFVLLAAGLTGAASFIYEIVWIRLLSLALGSTLHSFELMVSAFILGIAVGSLVVRSLFKRIKNVLAVAGVVQLLMAVAAASSLPLFNETFNLVSYFYNALDKTDSGYDLYLVVTSVIALMIMFPATFFAGMTLPLFTHALASRNHSERSIGHIYAANTLGSIVGVVVAVFLALPLLGLKGSLLLGALIDAALGIVLLVFAGKLMTVSPGIHRLSGACLLAVAALFAFGKLDNENLSSGTFRHGFAELGGDAQIDFIRHGRTSTISVYTKDNERTIATNGKPDASIHIGELGMAGDEPTMVVAAALPLTIHPDPNNVAIIGFGSGLTTHAVLLDSTVENVDTIEIEPQMVEGARLFSPRNDLAYDDARSKIHIDDAKAFFQRTGTRYDLIISEPSNPWVSGVGGLFSIEFYELIRNYLDDDGLLVQWIQAYEISEDLIATVFLALEPHFGDYAVFKGAETDLIIIASKKQQWGTLSSRVFGQPALKAELEEIGIQTLTDLQIRYVGNRALLSPLWRQYAISPNSDFFPLLSLHAPRARFRRDIATSLVNLRVDSPLPIAELTSEADWVGNDKPVLTPALVTAKKFVDASNLAERAFNRDRSGASLFWVQSTGQDCSLLAENQQKWLSTVHKYATDSIPFLPVATASRLWGSGYWTECEAVSQRMAVYQHLASRNWPALLNSITQQFDGLEIGKVRDDLIAMAILASVRAGRPDIGKVYAEEYTKSEGQPTITEILVQLLVLGGSAPTIQ